MKNRQSGYHLQKVKIYQLFGKIALLFFPFSGLFSLFHECVRFVECLSVTYMPADVREVNKVEC